MIINGLTFSVNIDKGFVSKRGYVHSIVKKKKQVMNVKRKVE